VCGKKKGGGDASLRVVYGAQKKSVRALWEGKGGGKVFSLAAVLSGEGKRGQSSREKKM